MTISFERPVGAHADVKELEFVAALHQTCTPLRHDASIDAQDIVYFLLSRYALETQEDVINEEILVQLAGDPEENPKNIIDLRQIAALLMIPHLVKVAAGDDKNDHIDRVLLEITSDLQDNDIEKLKLSKKLLVDLFDRCGESNPPEDLIEEMIELAGGEGATLDSEAFLRALTSDVNQYDPSWETKLSTHYADALSGAELALGRQDSMLRQASGLATKKQPISNNIDDIEEPKIEGEMQEKCHKVLAFSSIDHVADTYRSQTFTIILWAAFVCVYISYVYGNNTGTLQSDCDNFGSTFGCQVVNAIGGWFAIFAQLCILGGTFMCFGSSGNSIFAQPGLIAIAQLLFGIGIVILFTIVSNYVTWETWFFNTNFETQGSLFELFNLVALSFGAILLLLQVQMLMRLIVTKSLLQKIDRLHILLTPGMVKKESNTKRAAAFKANKMVENALELHLNETQLSTHRSLHGSISMRGNGLVMSNFMATSHVRETVGGIWWGWRRFFNSRICYEEGVWFHTRLLATAVAQVLLIILTLSLVYLALYEVVFLYTPADENGVVCVFGGCATYYDRADNATIDTAVVREAVTTSLAKSFGNTSEIQNELAQELFFGNLSTLVFEASGVNLTALDANTVTDFVEDPIGATREWLLENVEEWEALFGVGVGAFFGALGVVMIVMIYIPSFISNVLQFRVGLIATIHDKDFEIYRRNLDHTTTVFGTAFWGQMFTAGFAFFIPGVLGFFLVWSQTRNFVTGFVAQLIGISVTLLVKVLVLMILRSYLMVVFYRKKVALSNLVFVLLECWNIALSTGFMVARATLVFCIAIFYLGRVDTPFLAQGVGKFGNYSLDKAPVNYRKDLLLHEAHRHPYIERLGTLYLMKLRHGSTFGNRASSCWRLLYVLSLMPWMRQYRGRVRDNHFATSIKQRSSTNDNELEEEQPAVVSSSKASRSTMNSIISAAGGGASIISPHVTSKDELKARRQVLREESQRLTEQIESMQEESNEVPLAERKRRTSRRKKS